MWWALLPSSGTSTWMSRPKGQYPGNKFKIYFLVSGFVSEDPPIIHLIGSGNLLFEKTMPSQVGMILSALGIHSIRARFVGMWPVPSYEALYTEGTHAWFNDL